MRNGQAWNDDRYDLVDLHFLFFLHMAHCECHINRIPIFGFSSSNLAVLINNSARRMAANAMTHVRTNLTKKLISWATYQMRMLPVVRPVHRKYCALKVLYLVNGAHYEDPRFLSQEGYDPILAQVKILNC